MKPSFTIWLLLLVASLGLVSVLADEPAPPAPPQVSYPENYRTWRFLSSAVLSAKPASSNDQTNAGKPAAPHGLIHNVYANEKAIEGFRAGHFPEGAVLIADWFFLEPQGPELIQGARKSINVMVRDARYATTGGWGFEDFAGDSHTTRNVGANAANACFACHSHAKDHDFVFSQLKQ